jgi:hypothetical protein
MKDLNRRKSILKTELSYVFVRGYCQRKIRRKIPLNKFLETKFPFQFHKALLSPGISSAYAKKVHELFNTAQLITLGKKEYAGTNILDNRREVTH